MILTRKVCKNRWWKANSRRMKIWFRMVLNLQMVWHDMLFFLLQKVVQNSPNQFVIYSSNFSVFMGQKNYKRRKRKTKGIQQISNYGLQNKCVTPQSLKLVKISYCQFQFLTDTGLGKLGIMGKKKNSPSLWHDELAVCRGNQCYTKWAFAVLGTVWKIEMDWKILWQTKMRWMNFVCLFVFLLCGRAGESHPQIFCSPGVRFLCLHLVFHQLSLPEMLKCFIVLLSSFCNCQHLLIFLGLFSFVRKRTWIKLSMHDIY